MDMARAVEILRYYGIELVCENCERSQKPEFILSSCNMKPFCLSEISTERKTHTEPRKTSCSRFTKVRKSDKCRRKMNFYELESEVKVPKGKENRFSPSLFKNLDTTPSKLKMLRESDAFACPLTAEMLAQGDFSAKGASPNYFINCDQLQQTPCALGKSLKSVVQLTPLNKNEEAFNAIFSTATKETRSVLPEFGPLRVLDFSTPSTLCFKDLAVPEKINHRFF